MLTSFSDAERMFGALDAGAVGYILKDAEPDEVIAGIRAVSRGGPRSIPGPRATCSAPARSDNEVDLTPREAEVLGLIGQGLANKQIARRLGIRERTVKAHLTSAFARDRRRRPHPGRALGRAAGPGGLTPHPGVVRPLTWRMTG